MRLGESEREREKEREKERESVCERGEKERKRVRERETKGRGERERERERERQRQRQRQRVVPATAVMVVCLFVCLFVCLNKTRIVHPQGLRPLFCFVSLVELNLNTKTLGSSHSWCLTFTQDCSDFSTKSTPGFAKNITVPAHRHLVWGGFNCRGTLCHGITNRL